MGSNLYKRDNLYAKKENLILEMQRMLQATIAGEKFSPAVVRKYIRDLAETNGALANDMVPECESGAAEMMNAKGEGLIMLGMLKQGVRCLKRALDIGLQKRIGDKVRYRIRIIEMQIKREDERTAMQIYQPGAGDAVT